jgi:predicted outer membrane protein
MFGIGTTVRSSQHSRIFIGVGILALLSSPTQAQVPGPANPADRDKQFLEYMWQNDQAEIELGINAQKLAQAPAVIGFARLIVSDNSDLKTQLGPLLHDNHVEVPTEMVQQRANTIAPKAAVDFDSAFLTSQISHLRDDVTRYQDQQAASNNDGIHKVTMLMVPMLQQELAIALAVQSSSRTAETGAGTAGSSSSPR